MTTGAGTLRERLEAREELIRATGCYESEPWLQAEDPIRFEILYTKLVQVVMNAHEVGRLVSASPMTRELGEVIFGLYTPEGDAIALSHGLIVHVHTISRMIKWMIANGYEESMGFAEGDYYFNNDPYIGGAHALDQMIVTPIVWEGELVGWAAGLSHVPEVGATAPGGYEVFFRTRFEEGLFLPCVKIGENDQFRPDLELLVERSVRTPVYWLTDNRAKAAGVRMIREDVKKLLADVGLETYRQATVELIEDGFQAAKRKLRSVLHPGTYREIAWRGSIMPGEERLLHAPVELTVNEDGTIDLDFDGLSSAFWQPFQGSLPCLEGLVLNGLIQNVLYDTRHNEGTLLAVRMHVPEGTCCNPPSIFYPTTLWGPAYGAGVAVGQALGRAYYAAGYREEVHASSALSSGCTAGGIDQYGRSFGSHNMEFGAAGTPATAVADGLDTSGVEFNPEGDMGDAEIWEQMMPQAYLAREPRIDGGGYGKHRGGNGINSLYVMANTTEVQVGSFGSAPIFPSPGLMGGYPASCLVMWIGQNTNLETLIESRAPLPGGEGNDPAKPEFVRMVDADWECHPGANLRTRWAQPYDMFTAVTGDGGGFGDPIERDPEAVARDVRERMTTSRAASDVYCVALRNDGSIDQAGTEALRAARRRERMTESLPADEYRRRERQRLLTGDVGKPVRRCYNDLLRASPAFGAAFRSFWDLDDGFLVPGEE
ncbi:MAG: hydantoinase B/oxoprolinase family protein [Gaiellales bacterium]